MAVKKGYRRLKELEHLKTECGLDEKAMQAMDIPEDAQVVNITGSFPDGPIAIGWCFPVDEEQKKKNRQRVQDAVDYMLCRNVERYKTDPVYREEMNRMHGIGQ